jgi:peptidoglycan hydrolase-like protein with peptidoglycan-binding domain
MRKYLLTTACAAAMMFPAVAVQANEASQASSKPEAMRSEANASTWLVSPDKLSKAEISSIQQALNKQGFDAGNVDGIWGDETTAAVNNFQRRENIQARGQLDHRTLSALGVEVASQNQSAQNQSAETTGSAASGSNDGMAKGQASKEQGSKENQASNDKASTQGSTATSRSTTGSGTAAPAGRTGMQKPGFQNDSNPSNDAGGMNSSPRMNMDPDPSTRNR